MAILSIVLIQVGSGQVTRGQVYFQNLDFESANVSGYKPPGYGIPISAAFPGWSVTSPNTPVFYDGISLGGAAISICDGNTAFGWPGWPAILDGDFSAFLFGGEFGPATLSQTGLVPSYSRSLQMLVGTYYPYNSFFSISLGGQVISMIPLASFSNCELYGGDISSHAGKVETLSLTALTPPSPIVPPSFFLVDDIDFSPESVPEPTAIGLFALGGLFLSSRFVVRPARRK